MGFIMTFPVHISLCFAYICPHYPLLLILFLLLLTGPLVPSQHLRLNLVSAYKRKHELSCLSCLSLPFALTSPCLRLPFLPYCAHPLPCAIESICLNIGYILCCICSQLDSTQERKHSGVGHPGSANPVHLPEDDVIPFFLTAKKNMFSSSIHPSMGV